MDTKYKKKKKFILFIFKNTLMNPERVPLLSAMDQYSPVVETINSTVVLPEMNGFGVCQCLICRSSKPEQQFNNSFRESDAQSGFFKSSGRIFKSGGAP